MLLYLVRHGQTDYSAQNIVQGQRNVPLNEMGRLQSACLAEYLSGLDLTEIWSSDLLRARETADKIAERHPHLEVRYDERLRNPFQGHLEGEVWDPTREAIGGEPQAAIIRRLHSFLGDLIKVHTPLTSPVNIPKRVSPSYTQSPTTSNSFLLTVSSSSSSFRDGDATAPPPKPAPRRKHRSTPPSPYEISFGKITTHGTGTILIVTHQDCIRTLLEILSTPRSSPITPLTPSILQSQSQSQVQNINPAFIQADYKPHTELEVIAEDPSTLKKVRTQPNLAKLSIPHRKEEAINLCRGMIDLHIPPFVDTRNSCGETAMSIVRVWWEESPSSPVMRSPLDSWIPFLGSSLSSEILLSTGEQGQSAGVVRGIEWDEDDGDDRGDVFGMRGWNCKGRLEAWSSDAHLRK